MDHHIQLFFGATFLCTLEVFALDLGDLDVLRDATWTTNGEQGGLEICYFGWVKMVERKRISQFVAASCLLTCVAAFGIMCICTILPNAMLFPSTNVEWRHKNHIGFEDEPRRSARTQERDSQLVPVKRLVMSSVCKAM